MSERNVNTIMINLIEKRKRKGFSASDAFGSECRFLSMRFSQLEAPSESDNFYYIVSFITNVEAFCRHIIAELIDFDEDHLHLCAKMLEENLGKRELVEAILAIGSKKVSASEIISNAIPISSIDQMMKYLNLLTEGKIRAMLEDSMKRKEFLVDFPEFKLDRAFQGMKTLFKIRHILCHENSKYIEESKERLSEHFLQASSFLSLIKIVKDQILKVPELNTETDIREYIGQKFDAAEVGLRLVYETLCAEIEKFNQLYGDPDSASGDVVLQEFVAAQKAWEEFREAESTSFSNLVFGGSAMGSFYLAQKEKLTVQRADYLKETWKSYFQDNK